MLESSKIKIALTDYYLNKRQFYLCCKEQGIRNYVADFLVYDNKFQLIEVEIKVNKSDLMNELKAIERVIQKSSLTDYRGKYIKHDEFKNNAEKVIPHRFYFCVTEELLEVTKKYLQKSLCGILLAKKYETVFAVGGYLYNISVIKTGKLLHTREMPKKIINASFRNLCYENMRLVIANYKLTLNNEMAGKTI